MIRFVKTALAIALVPSLIALNTPAFADNTATKAPTVSPEERAKIEEVVHQYLMQKPEVLLEAMQVLQRKQFEQAEQTVKSTQKNVAQYSDALFHQANDPVAGNPNGKITVVEFFDYQCPHCINMAPVIAAILKANPDVRIVFKDFPIRGPVSDFAARAALAANKQGKYYELSHAILTANQPLTQNGVMDAAKTVKDLNIEQMKKDMNDNSVNTTLKNNVKLAQDLKLLGTPAFFIGKTDAKGNINYVPGQMNQAQLQQAIDSASK